MIDLVEHDQYEKGGNEMKLLTTKNHVIEIILSLFRWLFLLIAGAYFYSYSNGFNMAFLLLMLFGLVYMSLSQFALHRTPYNSKRYRYMTKMSVGFDYIAFLWLVVLTGGGESPVFPIAYLIILHVAVYWKFIGGMVASVFIGGGYTVILLFSGYSFHGAHLVSYLLDFMFLILMGILGGIIVSREQTMRTQNTKLEDMARKDFLTDLYNHRSFQEDIHSCAERGKPVLVVLADIDNFKLVNDQFGHMIGDHVLRKIGVVLKEQIRTNGRAYRYGGEELAILLDAVDRESARGYIKKIQDAIRNTTFTADDELFGVTMSFGTAVFPLENSIDQCLRLADERLYRAKRQGRDQIYWYDEYTEEGHAF